uniref:Glucosyl-3-phosphoglycerate synthase n=1 Tax=Caldilinea aerophila TaxID=133453 RepID=A0A7C1FN99_9CHLR
MSSRQTFFTPFRTALVPVLLGCDVTAALDAASQIAEEVRLVGLVVASPERGLSANTKEARALRRLIRQLPERAESARPDLRHYSEVLVASEPWPELVRYIAHHSPDLLVLDWRSHPESFGLSIEDILRAPPCDVALVRGPFPKRPQRVLMPLRGGPHAELVLNVGLALRAPALHALHLRPTQTPTQDQASFAGLNRVLRQMPEVRLHWLVTDDPVEVILKESAGHDLVILGATARQLEQPTSLGPVADAVLHHSRTPVIVLKRMRPLPLPIEDEMASAGAISILVDKWFAENTFSAEEFSDLEELAAIKREKGLTISLALPALNEEETVGSVIATVKSALMDNVPLLDEIVLIDSDSTDRTREIATELGVPVYIHQRILPQYGARRGKGEALWKSLYVTRGDIIAWIDTDIINIHPRFVYGIIGPLIMNEKVQLVKGFYRRPLRVGDKVQAGGGGRVTELMARPLINLLFPELSGVIQPLSGEYAGRRKALEQIVFYSGYGVETGMLIDVFEKFGLSAIAQVDLLERIHHNQPLEALSKMAFVILQTVMYKLEKRFGVSILENVNRTMKLVRYTRGNYYLDVEEVVEQERPPMITLPEYLQRHQQLQGEQLQGEQLQGVKSDD